MDAHGGTIGCRVGLYYLNTEKQGFITISFPEEMMIHDPLDRIHEGLPTSALIHQDISSVGDLTVPPMKMELPDRCRLQKVVNSGTWFPEYPNITTHLPEFGMK